MHFGFLLQVWFSDLGLIEVVTFQGIDTYLLMKFGDYRDKNSNDGWLHSFSSPWHWWFTSVAIDCPTVFVCKYLFSINNNSLGLYLSLTAFVNKICLMTLSDFFEYSCSKQWKIPFLWGKHLEMDIKCENLDRYTYVLHQLQWSLLLIGFKKIDLEWIIEMVIPNISSRVSNSI